MPRTLTLDELVSRLPAHGGSPYRTARATLGRRAPVADVQRLASRIERHARELGGLPGPVSTAARGGNRRGLWRWLAGVRTAGTPAEVLAAVESALPELEAACPEEVERLRKRIFGGRLITEVLTRNE